MDTPGRGGEINNGAQYNHIGGSTPGERNLISGNGLGLGNAGVWIQDAGTMNNTVWGSRG